MFLEELYNNQEEERVLRDLLEKVLVFIKKYPGCACEWCWYFTADICNCEKHNLKCFDKILEDKVPKDICKLLLRLCLYSLAGEDYDGCGVCWKKGNCHLLKVTKGLPTNDLVCFQNCLFSLDTNILNKRDHKRIDKWLEERPWLKYEEYRRLIRSIQQYGLPVVATSRIDDAENQ